MRSHYRLQSVVSGIHVESGRGYDGKFQVDIVVSRLHNQILTRRTFSDPVLDLPADPRQVLHVALHVAGAERLDRLP